MNEEFLLQAVGHIDEDLIAQAEEYRPAKRPSLGRPLAGLAACLAVVFALYWGADNLGMGGASNASGSAQTSQPSSSAGGASQESENQYETSDSSNGSPVDWRAAIQVDGQLYWSTGQTLSDEVDESAILGLTTYTDGLPEEDGQANFAREGARYARTDEGIAVEMDGEWVLFAPEE